MFSWHANIFVRLLIPFLFGIGINLSAMIPGLDIPVWVIFILGLLFFLQISLWKKYVSYSTSWQYAIFPNLFFFSLGFFLTANQKIYMAENQSFDKLLNKKTVYVGEVTSPVKETEKVFKFFCQIRPQDDSLKNRESKVLIMLKKDSL